jgi:hypothetical protein
MPMILFARIQLYAFPIKFIVHNCWMILSSTTVKIILAGRFMLAGAVVIKVSYLGRAGGLVERYELEPLFSN